jgi:hypothetical protein
MSKENPKKFYQRFDSDVVRLFSDSRGESERGCVNPERREV